MDLVVDASVIIAVIANEPEKDALVERTGDATLFAPESCHWEVGNAFSAMLRRGRVTLEQCRNAIEVYYRIPLQFMDVDLVQAVDLAGTLGIYAYDAYVIAAAQNKACPMITLDRRLEQVAQSIGVTVLEVRP